MKIKRPDARTIKRGILLLKHLKAKGPQHQAEISLGLDWSYRTTGYVLRALIEDGCVAAETRFGKHFTGKNAKRKGRKYYVLTPGGDWVLTTSLGAGKYQRTVTVAQLVNMGLVKIERTPNISDPKVMDELVAKARPMWENPQVKDDMQRLMRNLRVGFTKNK